MSQEMVSQKLQRTCDGCGLVKVWEMVNIQERPEQIEEMQAWYTVVREVFMPGEGFIKMMVQTCSADCLNKAAEKLKLPEPEPVPEESDSIDLAALQAPKQYLQ
jgi:hypothetical protein